MTNPDAIKPVAWMLVEQEPGLIKEPAVTANPKWADHWRETVHYGSVTPLVPLSALEAAVARGEALEAERDELRAGIKRLSDEEELCAETSGEDPFSLVYLAARLEQATCLAKTMEAEANQMREVSIANRHRAEEAKALLAEAISALEFYANPEVYRPHPHGPAFDRRDLSYHARDALLKLQDHPHE